MGLLLLLRVVLLFPPPSLPPALPSSRRHASLSRMHLGIGIHPLKDLHRSTPPSMGSLAKSEDLHVFRFPGRMFPRPSALSSFLWTSEATLWGGRDISGDYGRAHACKTQLCRCIDVLSWWRGQSGSVPIPYRPPFSGRSPMILLFSRFGEVCFLASGYLDSQTWTEPTANRIWRQRVSSILKGMYILAIVWSAPGPRSLLCHQAVFLGLFLVRPLSFGQRREEAHLALLLQPLPYRRVLSTKFFCFFSQFASFLSTPVALARLQASGAVHLPHPLPRRQPSTGLVHVGPQ